MCIYGQAVGNFLKEILRRNFHKLAGRYKIYKGIYNMQDNQLIV